MLLLLNKLFLFMNNMITVSELLKEAENLLSMPEYARLDAELLLCDVMHFDRSKLYSMPEVIIPVEKVREYKELINKRCEGQPLAYLTGKKEFWSLEFVVNQYTLIPRPETECLVEIALSKIPPHSRYAIADLGTGSGAIAVAIATERPGCKIMATDICVHAIEVARLNAARHEICNIDFVTSNWLDNIDEKFDLIISNPPYIQDNDCHLKGDGVMHEPKLALCGGPEGMDSIKSIVQDARKHLVTGGWLMIEHGYDQAEKVRAVFNQNGFTEIQSHCDYSKIERVTSGRYLYDRT